MAPITEIREAFGQALELPAGEIPAYLATLSAGVRAEVVSLLAAHASAHSFLEAPGGSPESDGGCIGPYRLIERIGHGGMGVVYRARRDDGEFQREVAIKLVGGRLFAPEAERRFIAERRILAMLDHPHIVRMIDGGVWNGQRYLVMELIAGRPLTDCVKDNLPIPQRLRLFQAVCEAIQYAHQRLILHRDLKPRNILVTSEGQVKVLDFGIARLLDDPGEGDQSLTALHPMTLEYASPEQVREEPLTLASDIYTLGLLLYELLSGVNPQAGGTRAGIIRRATAQDPVPPGNLAHGISPDLDAIVMQALAKDPSRRYASAEELSADVGRFLEHRPVLARAPSRLYVAVRFCARNKAVTAVACALLLAVLGGLAAVSWQARRAEHQRAIAQRRFVEARRLIYTVIHEIQPQLAHVDGTVAIRKSLIEKTLVYLEALAQDAAGNPDLTRELIDSYVQLASVSADASMSNTGDQQRAAGILGKAGKLADTLERAHAEDLSSIRTLLVFYEAAARNAYYYGSPDQGREYARHALALAERLMALAPGETASAEALAAALASLGAADQNDADKIAHYQRALAIYQQLLDRHPSDTARRNLALMYKNLASTWNDPRRSLESAAKARELDEQLLARDPSSPAARMAVAFDIGAIGWASYQLHDYTQAMVSQRQNVAIREQLLAANPGDRRAADRLAYALRDLAEVEIAAGDRQAARRDLIRMAGVYHGLARNGLLVSQSLHRYATGTHALGEIEVAAGRTVEACQWFQQAAGLADEYERREKNRPTGYPAEAVQIRQRAAACSSRPE